MISTEDLLDLHNSHEFWTVGNLLDLMGICHDHFWGDPMMKHQVDGIAMKQVTR